MITINKENWSVYYKQRFTSEWLLLTLDTELFQTDDRGCVILEDIEELYECVYSEGDGINTSYIKLFKKR
jgi:hypothetical protein